MSIASCLQLRRKTLAAVLGIWFVACGLLARRHEATVAHAVERATGALVHADRLIGHHDAQSRSDVHDRATDDAEHGACLEAAVLHASLTPAVRSPSVVAPLRSATRHDNGVATVSALAQLTYRLAPKTSPPAA